jgi:hypothetical protein
MMKVSEIRDFIKKTVKEMSSISGGTATATAGTGEQYFAPARDKKPKKAKTEVKDVEPKLAAGEVEDNYAVSHFGFTPAPSKPNRKSKAMDYKKIFEDEEERILTGGIPFKKETGVDYHKITIAFLLIILIVLGLAPELFIKLF